MNGIWGTLAVGIFATENGVSGLIAGNSGQLLSQTIGVLAVSAWCVITGAVLFFGILKGIVGLRVSKAEEMEGLDLTEHGAEAYALDVVTALE
jgi:Amt family ammonium transporter